MRTIEEMNNYFEALYALKSLYIWRYNGEVVTRQNIQDIYHEEHKSNPNSQYNSDYYTKKFIEATADPVHPRIASDCSGAFYQLHGSDTNAQGFYDDCTTKGNIATINPSVACMVFKGTPQNITHIGWNLGTGYTIEMESSATNCVKRKLSEGTWTYYGLPSWVDYSKNSTPNTTSIDTPVIPKVETTTPVVRNNIKCIDISHHNSLTDWNLLYSQIKDVIIRIGYRGSSTGALAIDNKFKEHITQAVSHKMQIGIYYYDQSINEAEAIEQADWCINMLKGYNITYPIYIDSEYANKEHTGRADGISVKQRTKNVIAFCERIKSKGYKAGVYASDSWFKSMLNFDEIKGYEIWVARYSTVKPSIPKYEGWQYGSEQFAWAVKPIDVNIFYKDYVSNVSTVVTNPTTNTKVKPLEQETELLCIATGNVYSHTSPDADASTRSVLIKNEELVNAVAVTSNGYWKLSTGNYVNGKYCHAVIGTVFNCNTVNVRSSADSTSKATDKVHNIIDSLNVGAQVSIMKTEKGFYKIKTSDGLVGYTSAKYIQIR